MRNPNEEKNRNKRSPAWPLQLVLFFIYVAVAAAAFLPGWRLWGINHLAFYSTTARIVLLMVMGLALIPQVSRVLYSRVVRAYEFLGAHRRRSAFAIVFVSIACGFVFHGFRSSTLLLGDGQVVANALRVTYSPDSTAVVNTLGTIARKDVIASGTTSIYYLVGVASRRLAGGEPVDSIRLFNVMLGCVFLFVLLAAIVRGSLSVALGLWMLLLALSSGAIQLFFGYVENYTLLYVLGTLYVIAGVRYIHNRLGLWVPVLIVVAATYAHVQGILLVPSLALIVVWRIAKRRDRVLLPATLALVVLAFLAAYVAARYTPLARFFLPPFTSPESYGVFSGAHWIDIFNELFLLVPVFPLIIVMGLWTAAERLALRRGAIETNTHSTRKSITGSWLTKTSEWHFVLQIVVPAGLYLLFFNPEIGFARDWDLFSIVAIGVIPLCLLVANRFFEPRPHLQPVVLIPTLLIGVVVCLAWVGVNASADKTTRRFEYILEYQSKRRDYAYEVLARTYHGHGRLADAIRAQEKASSLSQNPRHFVTLSRYYIEYGDREASFQVLQQTVTRHPRYRPARKDLIVSLWERRRFEEVVAVSQKGIEYNSQESFYHYFLGRGLIRVGKTEEGRLALLEAKRLGPDPSFARAIDNVLDRLDGGD